MNQLALNLGRSLKREGMDLTASKNSAWISECIAEIRIFSDLYPEFTMEQFRAYRRLNKRSQPSSPKAWGALTLAAVRAGVMAWTGRYTNAESAKTHAHPVKVWRSA